MKPALALALSTCALHTLGAQPSHQLDGTWAGILTSGARSAYTVLNISTRNDGTQHIDIGNPVGGGTEVLDGKIAARADGDSVWLPLRHEQGWLHLKGDRLLSGSTPAREPMVEFRRIRLLSDDEAAAYEGSYRFTDDHSDLVIASFLGRVAFFMAKDGRSARLNPDGADAFTNGPGGILHVPVEARWVFERGPTGEATRLHLTSTNGATRTAERSEAYRTETVAYPSGPLSIAGTLRVPRERQRRPAILLVSGSGPEPRNGFDGTEAFVADWLSRAGYVTLVYDKRGTGRSSGKYLNDNYDSLSTDAIAGLRFLFARSEVDTLRIGVWGMSQGGQLAPIIASRSPMVAFAMNTSGGVVNSNEAEVQRTEHQLQLDGFSAEDVSQAAAFQRLKFHYACKRDNWDEYAAAVTKWKHARWYPDPYVGPPESPDAKAWDFWKCGEEPGAYWEHFTKPVLAVYGANDGLAFPQTQVDRFRRAMATARNSEATVEILPGVGHSMKVQHTGSMADDYTFRQYSLEYFRLMAVWLNRVTGRH